ncbi:MAG: hypothetical protein SGPRY_013206, partial [Prymnesium sp.]
MFGIGLTARLSELTLILRPSCRSTTPFAAFALMLLLLLVVTPLAVYRLLHVLPLPPSSKLGAFLVMCTPGGLGSNLFAVTLDASVEMNAALTLAATLSTIILVPSALSLMTPALLSMPADQILSPMPVRERIG